MIQFVSCASGDDWEHEEIFTDDDEAVGNDPEEREDLLAPEIPAPPEIKQVPPLPSCKATHTSCCKSLYE